ncbi:ribonuclease H-like domain-containing protein [Tanacetum coccineum]
MGVLLLRLGGNTPRSDEGRMELIEELMETCTSLTKRVIALEEAKTTQDRRRLFKGRVETSTDTILGKDASKHGRSSDKTKLMFKDSDFDVLDAKQITTTGPSHMKEVKAKEKGVEFRNIEEASRPVRSITTLQPLPKIDLKDKGKSVLVKEEPKKVKRRYQGLAQIESDTELAQRLHEEELAEIDADALFAAKLQQEEREQFTIEERAQFLVETIATQSKFRAAQRAAEIRSKPPTKTQLRNLMMTYLKNTEKEAQKSGKKLKRVAGSYATQKSPKKPKVMKSIKNVTEEEATEYEKEKEKLKADGSSSYHGDMQAFLRRLDKQDLNDLYRLVQERFQDHPLEGHDLLLWGDLKMLFDPNEKDKLWMNQLDWKLLKWKLHENCGVHTLFMDGTPMEINMLVEKKYPLIKELFENVLNLQLEVEEESTMAFELITFIKSMLEEYMTGNKDFLTNYQDIDGGFIAFGGSARGVPMQSNMYSFDLRNVVPSGDLTCLFAKAIIVESKLWHRRLGLVNFKTINKLVKGNLVRGPQEANGNTADDAAGETPIQKPASENEQALKNVFDKTMDPEKEATEQSDAVRKEFEAQCNRELLQGKATRASSTNCFNIVSTPVNAASAPRTFNDDGPSFIPLGRSFPLDVNDPQDDPLMPDLEDTAEVQNTGIFGSAYDDDDLDTYNSPYADQVEPTKIAQAFDDESWVEAMQEELLQFKIQKV